MKTVFGFFILLASFFLLSGCGVQSIPQSKNSVDAAMAEVTNQYKRRSDLVPNLVEVVKGYAKHEEKTLTEVTEARAKATQMTIDPSKVTASQLVEFQKAQAGLSQALGRLLMVSENYPDLKANTNFRDLQAQLEGTENRITIARQRLIESIKNFNDQVTVPPTSWTNSLFYHHDKMAQWDVSAEEKSTIEKAPKVNF
ncbi:MAG: LemA family protein [Bdellovibrionales bacterium RBG_16_40_8]|nr:MAG: LemA family protein [Bdellovibrionales bacterium RBG_16_40_8]